jgi:hypothetical protein
VTSPPVFVDGFGARYLAFDSEAGEPGDPIEILCFDSALVGSADFGAALGMRVARLTNVRHMLFGRVRRLDRATPNSLLLVSDRVAGWRLSDVLDTIEREELTLDISAILSLLRQLIPAIALFARLQRELAVGTIGPERLILTPQGRLVLTEYVLGSAIEKLGLSREGLWRTYRVVSTPGATKIWTRSDAMAIGIVVLSLLLGRRLRDEEFPDALGTLHAEAQESSGGIVGPLSPGFTSWLGRALQLDPRTGFQAPHEAQIAFEEMLASERQYVTTPALLEAFVSRYTDIAGAPPEPGNLPEKGPQHQQPEPEPFESDSPLPIIDIGNIEMTAVAAPPAAAPTAPASAPAPLAPALAPVAFEPSPGSRLFEPAAEESPVREPIGQGTREWMTKALAGLALLVVLESIGLVWLWNRSSESLLRDGELVVQSQPAGAVVTLDDKDLGPTPVTTRLSPGTYTLKVQAGTGEPRVIVVQIRAGVQTVQYLELQRDR